MPVRSSSDDVGEDEERDILGSPSKSYKVEGDHTLDEPYIQVRPCFRITPLRLNDLDDKIVGMCLLSLGHKLSCGPH